MKKKYLYKILVWTLAASVMAGSEYTLSYAVTNHTAGLTKISANNSVNTVEEGIFRYELKTDGTAVLTKCLETFEINENETPENIDVVIPGEIKGHKVTQIGYEAFSSWMPTEHCHYINVILPDGMKTITENAFYNFEPLKSIVISDSVTEIGDCAFCYCANLKNVSMSKNIKKIGESAFGCCYELETVNIPDGITSIGNYAFENCFELKSMVFPASLTEIGENVLAGCDGLTDLTINCSRINDTASSGKLESLTNLYLGTNGEKVSLDTSSFYTAEHIKTVTLGKNAGIYSAFEGLGIFPTSTDIENFSVSRDNPFYSSENGILFDKNKTRLIRYPSAMKGAFTIPETVTEVDVDAFSNCKYLTEVNIPENVSDLQNEPTCEYILYPYNPIFFNCIRLKTINVSPNNLYYSSKNGILFDKNQTTLLRFPTTKRGSYTVPKSVKYLDYGSFNKTKLSDITIYSDTRIYSNTYNGKIYRDEVFSSNSGLTIITEEGSYAHTYAKQCKIPFELLLTNQSELSASRIVLGQTLTVNAKASRGSGNYTYAVYYKKNSQSKWSVAQDYSTNASIKITPAYAADYDICVKVKDGRGNISKKYFSAKVLDQLENISYISADSIPRGHNIIVHPKASGGFCESDLKKVYQYSVLYKKTSDKKWTVQNQYKSLYYEYDKSYDQTECITPAHSADYQICVKIKDEAGTVAKKYFTVHVREDYPLINESTISTSDIQKGESVVVKCSAQGGDGDYTYAVLYKKKSESKWTEKQMFDTNEEVIIKPSVITEYDICVKVKDKSNTIVKSYFSVTVN